MNTLIRVGDFFNQLKYVLGDERKKLPKIIILFWVMALLDLLGIGLIAPFITLVVNPEVFMESAFQRVFKEVFELDLVVNTWIIILGVCLSIAFYIKGFSAYTVNKMILHFSHKNLVNVQVRLMSAYQNMPYKHIMLKDSATLIHAVQSHTTQFSIQVIARGLQLLANGIVLISILSFLAWAKWQIVVALLILIGLIFVGYDLALRTHIKQLGKLMSIASSDMIKGIQNILEGIKDIRVLGKEDYFLEKTKYAANQQADITVSHQSLILIPRYLLESALITFIVIMVIMSLGSKESSENLFPLLGMFAVAALRILPSISQLIQGVAGIRYSRYAVNNLYNDLYEAETKNIIKSASCDGNIKNDEFEILELKNINFIYESAQDKTIKNISLTIKRGQSIGFCGTSGAGKSTLINLILGLLKPDAGCILRNGVEINNNISRWMNEIAYIPQDIFLVDDTLQCNIALGLTDNEVDEEHLNNAIDAACLNDLVKELPEGINTLIGERGARLSGGQRQRIALARALYFKRDILILDEATSSLDSDTEQEIVREIEALKSDKTIIVIAHRLSTLKHCDIIFRLHDGSIVEQLSYQELINSNKSGIVGD